MEIKWNRAELDRLQRDANNHVQYIVRKANDDLKGQPASVVEAELTKRLKAGDVQPDQANVHQLADEISKGEVTG